MTFRKDSILPLLRLANTQGVGVTLCKDHGVYIFVLNLEEGDDTRIYVRGCNPSVNLSYQQNSVNRFGTRNFTVEAIPNATIHRLLTCVRQWHKIVIMFGKIDCAVHTVL